jgi:anti-sigma-K factor RskA
MMDHDEVAELSGAYALDAVTVDEARAVEAHVSGCAACEALVDDMRATVRVLPFGCESVEPSAALKRRILDQAEAEFKAEARLRRNADLRGAPREAPRPAQPNLAMRYWGAAAAAAVLIAAGFAMGTMQARSGAAIRMNNMQAQAQQVREQLAFERAANVAIAADAKSVHGVVADVAHGKVWDMSGGSGSRGWHCLFVQPPNRKNATLIASVPPAPHGMTYQAWIIHKGKMHRAPVLPTGVAMIEMPMPLESGDVVAFSMEPPGGSAHPTGPFMMEQTLS